MDREELEEELEELEAQMVGAQFVGAGVGEVKKREMKVSEKNGEKEEKRMA